MFFNKMVLASRAIGEDSKNGSRLPERIWDSARAGWAKSSRIPANRSSNVRSLICTGNAFSLEHGTAEDTAAGVIASSDSQSNNARRASTHSRQHLIARLIGGAGALIVPSLALAAGGDPISQAAGAAVDLGTVLGALACAGGVMGAAAGGMLRNGGILGAGATTAVCGGAWAGAPEVVQQVIGGAAGASLSDLVTSPPTSILSLLF